MTIIAVLVIGLIVGLLARFITPGPNPRGIIVTIVIGIVGAVIATYGGQALGLYAPGEPAGFIGSVIGATTESLLAAAFEPSGVLNNDALNLINTAVAAYVAVSIGGGLP